jgi:hypothetical protein
MEIQPGGVVPFHSHADRPALIMVNQGQISSTAASASVPISHKAGEIARESNGLFALVEERRQRRRRAHHRRHRQRQEARFDDADDVAVSAERPVQIVLSSAAFFVAAICAGLMGYAIQRGATCTVAAMDEVVRKRSVNRLVAMIEASLWVVGGLLIARAFGALKAMPGGYEVTSVTILGVACWASALTSTGRACSAQLRGWDPANGPMSRRRSGSTRGA